MKIKRNNEIIKNKGGTLWKVHCSSQQNLSQFNSDTFMAENFLKH